MEITRLLSWIGFCSGLLISIPQVVKTLKTKNASGVSALTFILIEITALCFLIRALALRELALIIYYFVIFIASGLQLLLIYRYRNSKQ